MGNVIVNGLSPVITTNDLFFKSLTIFHRDHHDNLDMSLIYKDWITSSELIILISGICGISLPAWSATSVSGVHSAASGEVRGSAGPIYNVAGHNGMIRWWDCCGAGQAHYRALADGCASPIIQAGGR